MAPGIKAKMNTTQDFAAVTEDQRVAMGRAGQRIVAD
jgi:hypothetical protein